MDASVTTDAGYSARSGLEIGASLTFATVLFGLSVRASSPEAGLAVALAASVCAWAFWVNRGNSEFLRTSERDRQELRLLVAVVAFSCLGIFGWAPSWIGRSTETLERLPDAAWGLLAAWLFVTRRGKRLRLTFAAVTVLTLSLTLLVGVFHLNGTRDRGVDVFWLHRSAAQAIAEGTNPYTDAVEVANGAPTASPGETIVGYTYPPITAIAYSLGEWSLGDARYTSLASWLTVLGVIGVSACRRKNRHQMYVLLLLAAIPGWPLVLRAGWTEPFTLMLLVLVFHVWRWPTGSGAMLGLGLASKQYFILVVPLMLLHRDHRSLRRLVLALTAIVVTVGPALLLDLQSFWSAAVEFHTSRPLRTDSVNVVGAIAAFGGEWEPPSWLGPAIGIVVATLTGRLSRSRGSFFLAMALTLALAFLISSQALANYWFLITGLVALSICESSRSAITEREVNRRAEVTLPAAET